MASISELMKEAERLDERIDGLKAKYQQVVGEKTAIQKRLKEEFGITSTAKAKAALEEMEEELEDSKIKLENLINETDKRITEIEDAL